MDGGGCHELTAGAASVCLSACVVCALVMTPTGVVFDCCCCHLCVFPCVRGSTSHPRRLRMSSGAASSGGWRCAGRIVWGLSVLFSAPDPRAVPTGASTHPTRTHDHTHIQRTDTSAHKSDSTTTHAHTRSLTTARHQPSTHAHTSAAERQRLCCPPVVVVVLWPWRAISNTRDPYACPWKEMRKKKCRSMQRIIRMTHCCTDAMSMRLCCRRLRLPPSAARRCRHTEQHRRCHHHPPHHHRTRVHTFIRTA